MDPNKSRRVDKKRLQAPIGVVWHEGFGYYTRRLKIINEETSVRYLTCKDRFCRATAIIKSNGDFMHGRSSHTHPRDGVAERNTSFKQNLKSAVFKGQNKAIRDIYNEVRLLYPQAAVYYPYDSVDRSMRRWRSEAHVDALTAAPAVGGRRVVDGADIAPADDIADAKDSDTALVDDFDVADNTDAATVDGAAVTGGADVAHHADPDDSVLDKSDIKPLVAADPVEVPKVVSPYVDLRLLDCVICELKKRTHVFVPCGHYAICQDCAEILNCSGNNQCVKCEVPTDFIMRVLHDY